MPTLLPTNAVFNGTHPSEVGHLTHALIGSHVQAVHGTAVPGDLLQRMYAVAYAVIDASPSRTRVLATEAASYAYRYLTTRRCCTRPPWQPSRLRRDRSPDHVRGGAR